MSELSAFRTDLPSSIQIKQFLEKFSHSLFFTSNTTHINAYIITSINLKINLICDLSCLYVYNNMYVMYIALFNITLNNWWVMASLKSA